METIWTFQGHSNGVSGIFNGVPYGFKSKSLLRDFSKVFEAFQEIPGAFRTKVYPEVSGDMEEVPKAFQGCNGGVSGAF